MTFKQPTALTNADRDDERGELAMRLLVFLSGRQEDLERLFAVCGVDPATVRARIQDRTFQQGLLDYVLSTEPLLLAFCEETGEDPTRLSRLAQSDNATAQDWP